MRWPIRYQILLPFAGVTLAVLLTVSLLNAYLAARQSEQQVDAQLREVVHTLSDATFPLTDAVLRQTRGLSGAHFVLSGPSGQITASSMTDPQLPSSSPAAVQPEQFVLGPVVEVDAQRYFHTVINLRERTVGPPGQLLHILYPEHFLTEARRQAAYPPLVVGAVAVLIVSVWATAIAGRLSRPILQLHAQVQRLVRGDFQPVSIPERNDELRDLVSEVNSLAGQLDELRQAIKRSERLALLGQLSGGLAHHLRNDVTGARMAVQLHQRQCQVLDQESLVVALRQLALTEEHLKRFLAAGQPQPPQRVSCDLTKIVADLITLVEPSCQHRKVDLQTVNLTGLPLLLSADAEQLRQLLMNVVLNGIEAAGPGGWVRIEMNAAESMVRLRVCDSGPGPPPEIVARLFEPFTTAKREGVGLGLTVARQIAEAHGGSLRLVEAPNTCFELCLPADDQAKPAAPAVATPPAALATS